MSPNKSTSVFAFTFLISLSAIPIFIYYYYIGIYAVNIPFWDDFSSIYEFTNSYMNSDCFADKLHLIFSQHNEHRIVFNRVLTLIIFYTKGNIDLRILIWIGNLSLLGIAFLLLKSVIKRNKIFFF